MLHIAATIPDSKCLDYLIKQKMDVNEVCNSINDLASPLNFAVLSGNLKNAETLLKNGALCTH